MSVRVHKTIGDDSCEVLAHWNDRDERAATNMLLTALRVLKCSTWPFNTSLDPHPAPELTPQLH